VLQAGADQGRLGLLGMRERVELVGGTLTVESSPGAGATLFVRLPCGEAAEKP
jgi:signal transduction histidine kinase